MSSPKAPTAELASGTSPLSALRQVQSSAPGKYRLRLIEDARLCVYPQPKGQTVPQELPVWSPECLPIY